MNWSTRLRRWVRIRTPPVREASMKPTAATVLPAPVACSNQKRRLAPGSSGASSISSSSSSASGVVPVLGLLVGRERVVLLVLLLVGAYGGAVGGTVGASLRLGLCAVAVAAVAAGRALRALEFGGDRGERARECVDLMLVELGAVEQLGLAPRRAGARDQAAASSRAATRARALRPRLELPQRRVDARGGGRCRARGRRSSRLRAGSVLGRTPARDRVQTRSVRQPRSRPRWWYLPWAKGELVPARH